MIHNSHTFWIKTMGKSLWTVCFLPSVWPEIWGSTDILQEINESKKECVMILGKISPLLSGLACRQWPPNSLNHTKGDQLVMEGGVLGQIQSQIIYWLDIRAADVLKLTSIWTWNKLLAQPFGCKFALLLNVETVLQKPPIPYSIFLAIEMIEV